MPDLVNVNFDELYQGLNAERKKVGSDEILELANGWALSPLRAMHDGSLTGQILIYQSHDPNDPLLGPARCITSLETSQLDQLQAQDRQTISELWRRVQPLRR